MRAIAMFLTTCLLLPAAALARDEIRAIGSSTVFPFAAATAEQFGRAGKFRTPIVESTGTGGGFKVFCGGVGDGYPDLADASRPIKESEIKNCADHGVTSIAEIKIGYDGIVMASARQSPDFRLTRHDIFLALAREVPKDGKLVPNFYRSWHEVNASLPDVEIEVYGPPPTEGTRDAFGDLVMIPSCKDAAEFVAAFKSEKDREKQCTALREDGRYIEVLGGNLMVQKLVNSKKALGIFGYNYLEQNAARIKGNPVEGVMPGFDSIVSGKYTLARSLFVYVKNAQADKVPGLRDFVNLLAADSTSGPEGFLILKGLLPLPAEEHERMKKVAAELTPLPR